jgi:hypothetical protein
MIFSQKPFYFCFSTSPLIPCSLNIVNQFLFPLKQPLFPAAFPFPCFLDKITNSIHLSLVVVFYAIQSPTSIFKGAIYYPFVQPKYCLAVTSQYLSHSIQTAIILRFPYSLFHRFDVSPPTGIITNHTHSILPSIFSHDRLCAQKLSFHFESPHPFYKKF